MLLSDNVMQRKNFKFCKFEIYKISNQFCKFNITVCSLQISLVSLNQYGNVISRLSVRTILWTVEVKMIAYLQWQTTVSVNGSICCTALCEVNIHSAFTFRIYGYSNDFEENIQKPSENVRRELEAMK